MFIYVFVLYHIAMHLYYQTHEGFGAVLMHYDLTYALGSAMRYGADWAQWLMCSVFIIIVIFVGQQATEQ